MTASSKEIDKPEPATKIEKKAVVLKEAKSLPADIRTQLEGAMKQATEYANKIAQQENEAALEAIRKSGKTTVYVPTEAEKAEWRKTLLPVHKAVEDRIGRDLVAAAVKAASGK